MRRGWTRGPARGLGLLAAISIAAPGPVQADLLVGPEMDLSGPAPIGPVRADQQYTQVVSGGDRWLLSFWVADERFGSRQLAVIDAQGRIGTPHATTWVDLMLRGPQGWLGWASGSNGVDVVPITQDGEPLEDDRFRVLDGSPDALAITTDGERIFVVFSDENQRLFWQLDDAFGEPLGSGDLGDLPFRGQFVAAWNGREYVVAWRSSTYSMNATRIAPDGSVGDEPAVTVLSDLPGSSLGAPMRLVPGPDGTLLTWAAAEQTGAVLLDDELTVVAGPTWLDGGDGTVERCGNDLAFIASVAGAPSLYVGQDTLASFQLVPLPAPVDAEEVSVSCAGQTALVAWMAPTTVAEQGPWQRVWLARLDTASWEPVGDPSAWPSATRRLPRWLLGAAPHGDGALVVWGDTIDSLDSGAGPSVEQRSALLPGDGELAPELHRLASKPLPDWLATPGERPLLLDGQSVACGERSCVLSDSGPVVPFGDGFAQYDLDQLVFLDAEGNAVGEPSLIGEFAFRLSAMPRALLTIRYSVAAYSSGMYYTLLDDQGAVLPAPWPAGNVVGIGTDGLAFLVLTAEPLEGALALDAGLIRPEDASAPPEPWARTPLGVLTAAINRPSDLPVAVAVLWHRGLYWVAWVDGEELHLVEVSADAAVLVDHGVVASSEPGTSRWPSPIALLSLAQSDRALLAYPRSDDEGTRIWARWLDQSCSAETDCLAGEVCAEGRCTNEPPPQPDAGPASTADAGPEPDYVSWGCGCRQADPAMPAIGTPWCFAALFLVLRWRRASRRSRRSGSRPRRSRRCCRVPVRLRAQRPTRSAIASPICIRALARSTSQIDRAKPAPPAPTTPCTSCTIRRGG